MPPNSPAKSKRPFAQGRSLPPGAADAPVFLFEDPTLERRSRRVLAGLPALFGRPIRIQRVAGLRDRYGPVHGASYLRERRIAFDCTAAEFPRIFVHELFHFVWLRGGKPRRGGRLKSVLRSECGGAGAGGAGVVGGVAEAGASGRRDPAPRTALAGVLLRELLRYRGLALLRAAAASRIHAGRRLPASRGRVVSTGSWKRGVCRYNRNRKIICVCVPSLPCVRHRAPVGLSGGRLLHHAGSVNAASVKPDNERKEAPDFALKDADGKLVHLSDYKGKVVLLDFWATWCGPCKIEIPWFMEMQRKNKDRGFEVVGVAMDDEGWEVVKPFITKMAVNYRILAGNDQTAQSYGGVDALPTTFLIDRTRKDRRRPCRAGEQERFRRWNRTTSPGSRAA